MEASTLLQLIRGATLSALVGMKGITVSILGEVKATSMVVPMPIILASKESSQHVPANFMSVLPKFKVQVSATGVVGDSWSTATGLSLIGTILTIGS